MALKKTRFIKGITIVPDDLALDSVEGELKIDSADKKIKTTLNSTSREIITDSQSQSLSNKTLETPVINGTVSGTALEPDLAVSAASNKLASASVIKTYVDNKVASKDEASEIAVSPVVGNSPNNDTVQKVLETHESRLDSAESNISGNASAISAETSRALAAEGALATEDLTFVKLDGTRTMTGSLRPTNTNTLDLGTPSLNWRELHNRAIFVYTSGGTNALDIKGYNSPSGQSSVYGLLGRTNSSFTGVCSESGAFPTKTILVESGNSSDGSNTGDISLRTGTTSGARGKILFQANKVESTTYLQMNNNKITALATPTDNADAVNKSYADAIAPAIIVRQTSFAIDNAQSSPVAITGLALNPSLFRSAKIEYALYRQTDTASSAVAQVGQLRIVYNSQLGEWLVSDDYAGQNAGVEFSVDNTSGQVSYTSSDLDPDNSNPNYVGSLKYDLIKTFGV